MKYFVQILSAIMLATILSLTTCQNTGNSPRKPLVLANMRRVPERQHNQEKPWIAKFKCNYTFIIFTFNDNHK